MRTMLALLAGLLLAVPARAQYGYSGYGYTYGYQPVYAQQKIVAGNIAVAPLLVTVPVDSRAVPVQAYGAPYYYSVADAYQARNIVRDVVRDELRAYAAQQAPAPPSPQARQPLAREVGPPPAPQPPAPQPPPAAGDTPPPPPQPPRPAGSAPTASQQEALTVLEGKANCVNCHGPQGKSKFKLVDDAGNLLDLPPEKKWQLYGMVSAGAMPPAAVRDPAQALDPAALSALLPWVAGK